MPPEDGQGALAAALLAPAAPVPSGLRTWNGSDPARRYAVYRNNVAVSLGEVLAARFPVTRALVGAEYFSALAALFVRQAPPRSPLVFAYGDGFAAFLAGFPPLAGWPFLPDVCRVENARAEVLHAADVEPLEATAFAGLGAAIADTRLRLIPALRILRSTFAVVDILAAHETAAGPEAADLSQIDATRPQDALVARPGDAVETHLLAPGVADFLLALAGGATIGEAAETAAAHQPAFDPALGLATLIRGRIAAALLS